VQTTKPKIQRSYVRVTDAATRRTVAWTIYNATPEQIRTAVEKAMKSKPAATSAVA
jgi:hypothetical protein